MNAMYAKIVCILLWSLPLVCGDETCSQKKITIPDSVIQRLFELVLEGQTRSEYSPVTGQTKTGRNGSYKNVIKLHRVGDSFQTAQRWAFNINDLNAFVPMWISIVLLESHTYGRAPRPSDKQLISTVEFCSSFSDLTKPYNNSLISFWPYFFDDYRQNYFSSPIAYVEFMNLAKLLPNNDMVNRGTNDITNLGIILQIINEASRIMTGTANLNEVAASIFHQLATAENSVDADDTFVWLGLGSMLNLLGDEFPKVRDKWFQYNSNISSAFDALKKYAYRPFSTNPLENTIEPTSYYVLRDFLDQAKAADKAVAISTTWLTNADEKVATARGSLMHKIINDIDATVCSNVVNGITTSILSGLVGPEILQDVEINQIYHNTSALLVYLIDSNFTNRPDLALPYYPSRYQFYWTVARTVSVMDSYKRKQDLPVKVMEEVFKDLKRALEGEATMFLLANAKHGDDGSVYFDDFLGNGDMTEDNKPIVRGEDRIFTTAMAANVLMYTWLSFDADSSKSHWKIGTPQSVNEIVEGCISWLTTTAFEGKFKPWNAVFSTQNKGRDMLPFRYPANIYIEKPQPYPFQFVTNLQVMVGMRGYVPKSEYETMINRTHFGKPTPTIFKGFNDPDFSDMIFWSSDPFTYALTLLALSRYREIEVSGDNFCTL